MRGILLRWAINVIAVFAAAWVLNNPIRFDAVGLAIFAAVLGLINAFLKPLVVLLALPAVLLTLGLFLLIVNALMFWLASVLLGGRGFEVANFGEAFLASLVVSIVSWGLSFVIRD